LISAEIEANSRDECRCIDQNAEPNGRPEEKEEQGICLSME
jgi:hypothetical protein